MIMGMRVALQLFSLRNEMAVNFEATLEKVKEMGYEGVEFSGLFGIDPVEIKAMVEQTGLTAISAHVPIDELILYPDKCIETYQTIGCSYIVIPWLDETRRPGAEGYERIKNEIKTASEICSRQGMKLLYHNHSFEFIKINSEYALDLLFNQIPLLETEIDTCWVHYAGENPASYITKYSGRCPVVHLKDYKLNDQCDKNIEFQPIGMGLLDFCSILDAAAHAGTKWVVVEQDKPTNGKTPAECVKSSMDFLNSFSL